MLRSDMADGRGRDLTGLGGLTLRSGQATVEYLIVLGAFAAMLAGLALVWHAGGDGDLSERAVDAASHGTEQGTAALLKDVMSY